jgi:hypothetical protein
VQKLVKDETKKRFPDVIRKLIKSWNKCVEVEGDYVEK